VQHNRLWSRRRLHCAYHARTTPFGRRPLTTIRPKPQGLVVLPKAQLHCKATAHQVCARSKNRFRRSCGGQHFCSRPHGSAPGGHRRMRLSDLSVRGWPTDGLRHDYIICGTSDDVKPNKWETQLSRLCNPFGLPFSTRCLALKGQVHRRWKH